MELFKHESINISEKVSDELVSKLVKCLISTGKNRKDKVKDFTNAFGRLEKVVAKQVNALVTLILGMKVEIKDLFYESDFNDFSKDEQKIILQNSKQTYEELRPKYETLLGNDISILDICKRLYDAVLLVSIKPQGKYLSEVKVEEYESHKKQLLAFKELIKI